MQEIGGPWYTGVKTSPALLMKSKPASHLEHTWLVSSFSTQFTSPESN